MLWSDGTTNRFKFADGGEGDTPEHAAEVWHLSNVTLSSLKQ